MINGNKSEKGALDIFKNTFSNEISRVNESKARQKKLMDKWKALKPERQNFQKGTH